MKIILMFESFFINLLKEKIFLGILVGAIFEYLFPPVPSEIVLPLGGYFISINKLGIFGLLYGILFASVGTTVGAILYYYLALSLGRKFIEKYGKKVYIDKRKLKAAEKWFKKYGKMAVLIGRLIPGIRELISIPAGILKMNLGEYIFYTFVGANIWSTILVSSGYFFGKTPLPLLQQLSSFIFFIILLSLISYLIFKKILTKS